MSNFENPSDEFAEKRIIHDPIFFDGMTVFPKEMIELALSKAVPGEFAEKRIIHDVITFEGKSGQLVSRSKVFESNLPSIPQPTESPEAKAAVDRFIAAITDLPTDYQAIFALRLEGLSMAEISARIGISPSAVATQFSHLLDRLRDQYSTGKGGS